jgi:hypothetical protein
MSNGLESKQVSLPVLIFTWRNRIALEVCRDNIEYKTENI